MGHSRRASPTHSASPPELTRSRLQRSQSPGLSSGLHSRAARRRSIATFHLCASHRERAADVGQGAPRDTVRQAIIACPFDLGNEAKAISMSFGGAISSGINELSTGCDRRRGPCTLCCEEQRPELCRDRLKGNVAASVRTTAGNAPFNSNSTSAGTTDELACGGRLSTKNRAQW